MQGLSRVEFLKELYDGNEAFVVLGRVAENGAVFHSAEYVRTEGDMIADITTISNDPDFWRGCTRTEYLHWMILISN